MDLLGEIALWTAVYERAWADAFKNLTDSNSQKEKQSAIKWFHIENQNFLHVCDCAQKDPYIAIDKFNRRINNDFSV